MRVTGKRLQLDDIKTQRRGGKGLSVIRLATPTATARARLGGDHSSGDALVAVLLAGSEEERFALLSAKGSLAPLSADAAPLLRSRWSRGEDLRKVPQARKADARADRVAAVAALTV